MKKLTLMKSAINAARRSALAWGRLFLDEQAQIYRPDYKAGEKSLTRAGRSDLIPMLRRRLTTGKFDVSNACQWSNADWYK